MTTETTDETPENRTDIESRLARIEDEISELRSMIERQDQTRTTETPDKSPVTPANDRVEAVRTTAQGALAKVTHRARRAAHGAGLPLWAIIVIAVLAVIGLADLVDIDMPRVIHL
jgi:hypothetical protein